MGWKNLKEHYRIEHIVHVKDGDIYVGSPLITDLIHISKDGRLIEDRDLCGNEELERIWNDIEEDLEDNPEKLRELIETPDTFERSIPVYTYQGSEIIEKLCETPGFPNVTHDGLLMSDNTFSTDREKIVAKAKRNAKAAIKLHQERINDLEAQVAERRALLLEETDQLLSLDEKYPDIKPA